MDQSNGMHERLLNVDPMLGYAQIARHYAERRIMHKVKIGFLAGAVVVAAVVGGVVGYEANGLAKQFEGIVGPANTKPKVSAAVKPDVVTETIQQLSCNAVLDFNVGTAASARQDYISGFSADETLPFSATYCNQGQGLQANTLVTKTAAGKVKDVKVYLPQYFMVNPALNFNDAAVMCSGLSSAATETQLNQARATYQQAISSHQTVNCNINEHTTGLGLASDQTAAAVIYAAQLGAQNAADTYFYSQKQEQAIDATIAKQVISEETKTYAVKPNQVQVVPPPYESPVQQLERDWLNNGKTIKESMRSVRFVDELGTTKLDESTYWGTDVSIGVPYLNPQQVSEVNGFISTNQ